MMRTTTLAVVAVLVLSFLAVGAVLAIVLLRPGQDNAGIITTILGFLVPTVTALLVLLRQGATGDTVARTAAKVDDLHATMSAAAGVPEAPQLPPVDG